MLEFASDDVPHESAVPNKDLSAFFVHFVRACTAQNETKGTFFLLATQRVAKRKKVPKKRLWSDGPAKERTRSGENAVHSQSTTIFRKGAAVQSEGECIK